MESIQNTVCNKCSDYLDNTSLFLAEAYIDLVSIAIKRNFNYITKIFSTPCMHTSNNSFMIDTNGDFYSCLSAYGIEEFKIDFKDGKYLNNYNKRNSFKRIDILEKKCINCEYLPCCYGGCAYELFVNGKNIFKDINCRKKYFDYILKLFYTNIYLKTGVSKIE